MKKYAADNLLFLRSQYPNLYAAIRNRAFDKTRYVPDVAKNGLPILRIREQGRETSLYSRYDPALEAARWVESLQPDAGREDNVLLFGFGFGYHAAALLQAFPDKKLYIYEPDPDIFLAAVESVDLRPVLQNRQIAMFAVGSDAVVQEHMMLQIYQSSKGSFFFAIPPAYHKRHAGLIALLARQARNAFVSHRINVNTIRRFRKEWVENILVNAARNLHTKSFRGLQDSCRGMPAVIAGSGPSLGMEIESLKAIRDRVLLIAAGSSIQSLLHHGVEPDLIVSMDAGEANRRVFEKLDVSHIPFLYVPMIKHTAIRDAQSPFLLHAYFDVDALSQTIMAADGEDVVFGTSSTVSGTALQAAAFLGCREMILIGQDFSFPDDRVYASGVRHFSERVLQEWMGRSEMTVRNVAGGVNRTNQAMYNLKLDTEKVIAELPDDVRVYNASPVGAAIEHTVHGSFQTLAEQLAGEPRSPGWFKAAVLDRAKPISPEKGRKARMQIRRFAERFRRFAEHLGQLQALLDEATERPAGAGEAAAAEWLARFDRIWPAIVDSDVFQSDLGTFIAPEYDNALRHWPDIQAAADRDSKRQRLLSVVRPLADALAELVPACRKGLQHLTTAAGFPGDR